MARPKSDPKDLGLPTDEALDRTVRAWREGRPGASSHATQPHADPAGALVAPQIERVPKPERRRRQRSVEANRDLPTLRQVSRMVRQLDKRCSGQAFDAAVVLLADAGGHPRSVAAICAFTHLPAEVIQPMVDNLYRNGTWRGGHEIHVEWMDPETGVMAFWCDVLVAVGTVCRVDHGAPAEYPTPGRKKRTWARGPEHCKTCQRLGEHCRRHGGKSRSTSFGGHAGTCGYCRSPSGHTKRCRKAVIS